MAKSLLDEERVWPLVQAVVGGLPPACGVVDAVHHVPVKSPGLNLFSLISIYAILDSSASLIFAVIFDSTLGSISSTLGKADLEMPVNKGWKTFRFT